MALLIVSIPSMAQEGVGRIVRIPMPIAERCINARTDEITATLRYIKTQKTKGFFTDDNRAGVTVIATLNSDGNPKAQNPSVNLIGIQNAPAGQVYLPLEYPIASLLALSSDSGKTFTKNILLELFLDKTRGKNTFGTILDVAGTLLAKLPIPANPYTNAVSQVVSFATSSIAKETTDAGGQLFASVALQFNDRDQPDINQCHDNGFESTGAIAVVGAKGAQNTPPLPLDRLGSDYCWRYVPDITFEVQYAPKPQPPVGCAGVSPDAFKDVPNDYVMMVLAAQVVLPPTSVRNIFAEPLGVGRATILSRRQQDLEESRKLCAAMKLNSVYCGAQ
jgi:hypothetical protein